MKKYIMILLLIIIIPAAADDPRFSRVLEYALMDECVGETQYRKKKVKICACALAKTQEDGLLPDYDNDGDFYDDRTQFVKTFKKNIRLFSEEYNECSIL